MNHVFWGWIPRIPALAEDRLMDTPVPGVNREEGAEKPAQHGKCPRGLAGMPFLKALKIVGHRRLKMGKGGLPTLYNLW